MWMCVDFVFKPTIYLQTLEKWVEYVYLITGMSFVKMHHNLLGGQIGDRGEDTFSHLKNFWVTPLWRASKVI